jgi:chromosome segregation ATPase
MTDEELVKMARLAQRDDRMSTGALYGDLADRIEELTEQLEAARADAKEAEAYAEELERDLKTCRMAQAVMEKLAAELEKENTRLSGLMSERGQMLRRYDQMVVDGAKREEAWKAKLAKAVEALDRISKGDYRVNNVPDYVKDPQPTAKEIARTALAEIKGEKG